jgi:hypothetical protein
MRADQFRRRAFQARQRASQTDNQHAQSELAQIADEWTALAEQVEWLEQRYHQLAGTPEVPPPQAPQLRAVVQQQQQVQSPKPPKAR